MDDVQYSEFVVLITTEERVKTANIFLVDNNIKQIMNAAKTMLNDNLQVELRKVKNNIAYLIMSIILEDNISCFVFENFSVNVSANATIVDLDKD